MPPENEHSSLNQTFLCAWTELEQRESNMWARFCLWRTFSISVEFLFSSRQLGAALGASLYSSRYCLRLEWFQNFLSVQFDLLNTRFNQEQSHSWPDLGSRWISTFLCLWKTHHNCPFLKNQFLRLGLPHLPYRRVSAPTVSRIHWYLNCSNCDMRVSCLASFCCSMSCCIILFEGQTRT